MGETTDDFQVEDFPPDTGIRLIAEIVGVGVALQLVKTIGAGKTQWKRRFYCAQKRRASRKLVAAIGAETAERIRILLSGQYVRVPSIAALEAAQARRLRDAAIRERFLQEGPTKLAQSHQVTRQNVYRIACKKLSASDLGAGES